ncbi:MAG: hypothetical protein K6G38_06285 [Gammaproteobacteria bacterium]|nr:hypothetical protein [Gammaproteobacteria bacterium]
MSKKIITTAGTEFAQNLKDLALIDTADRAGKPTMISSVELNEGFTNAESDVKALVSFDVNGEEISITPTTSQQVITPSTGKNAILKATVAAVDATIDANIAAGNIKDGVTILGVAGTYVKPEDANLVPENIKKGVTIYGVEGTYEA